MNQAAQPGSERRYVGDGDVRAGGAGGDGPGRQLDDRGSDLPLGGGVWLALQQQVGVLGMLGERPAERVQELMQAESVGPGERMMDVCQQLCEREPEQL